MMLERMTVLSDDTTGSPAIEVQATARGGTEFFVGVSPDPILGPILSFGLGGIFLEIIRDVAYAVPPITSEQATELLTRLKGWAVLSGARGQEPRDVTALAQLISQVSLAVTSDASPSWRST